MAVFGDYFNLYRGTHIFSLTLVKSKTSFTFAPLNARGVAQPG